MNQSGLFFSHRSVDAERVGELKTSLKQLLPNLPFDDVSEQVPFDDSWMEAATSIIESCDGMVCIVGLDTHESEPVDWELREAHRLNKPLVIARLSESFELPPACRDLHLDVVDWDTAKVAGQIGELLVPKALFLRHDWDSGAPDSAAIWDQYNLIVQTSEALIERRQTVNTLYVSAGAAFLAGIGILVSSVGKTNLGGAAVVIALVGFLGAALSFNWRRTVSSYGTLNEAKYKLISAFEEYMPAQLFDAEWKVLEAKRYKSTTDTDKQSALFFLLLFLVISVVASGVALGQLI